ncbi:MAG: replication initiation factor domain-containing protein [Colwellia sp.]|nr:replication initiation factor domain-containing protein [Colwellia sp.]
MTSLEDTIRTQAPYIALGSTPNNTDQVIVTDCNYLTSSNIKSRIDYVIINFEVDDINEFDYIKSSILAWLQCIGIVASCSKPHLGQSRSLNYFNDGQLLIVKSPTSQVCGAIKWNKNKSVFRVELSGRSCNRINTYHDYFFVIQDLADNHKAIVRRLDIAVDDFTGDYGIRFVQQAVNKGLYKNKTGRMPKYTPLKKGNERTIQIGSNKSLISLCVYEKGKQMGLPTDHPDFLKRVRHELRLLGRKGHVIPIDALFQPDHYFVSTYPKAHRRIIKNTTPRCIKREVVEQVDISLDRKLKYARRQIGPSIFLAQQRLTDSEIINAMSRQGVSNQLSYPDFITANDLALLPYKYL